MKHEIVWRPEALIEFQDALSWYHARSIYAGGRMAANFRSKLEQIVTNPARFPQTQPGCRWARVPKFPYQIHYAEEGGSIVILAFWHEKRDRQTLRRRLAEG